MLFMSLNITAQVLPQYSTRPIQMDLNTYQLKAKQDYVLTTMMLGTFILLNAVGDNISHTQRDLLASTCMSMTLSTFFIFQRKINKYSYY